MAWCDASATSWSRRLAKNGSAPTTSAPACSRTEGCEGCVDLALATGLQDRKLQSLRARRFPHLSHDGLGNRAVRVHEQRDHLGLGNSSEISSSRLGVNSTSRMLMPVRLPAGRARLATSPTATGSAFVNTIGIV
jgi:hypothetical protein